MSAEKEMTMRNLIKGAFLAAALVGASFTGAAVTATPAQAQVGISIGAPGFSITYRDGYYRDRYGRRHYYRYPSDYRRYGHPREWYYHNRYWDRPGHRHYYRGDARYRGDGRRHWRR
jgi:hypothetical protein